MKERAKALLFDALRFAAWITVWSLLKLLPDLAKGAVGLYLQDLATGVLAVLVVYVVIDLAFGWPRFTLAWSIPGTAMAGGGLLPTRTAVVEQGYATTGKTFHIELRVTGGSVWMWATRRRGAKYALGVKLFLTPDHATVVTQQDPGNCVVKKGEVEFPLAPQLPLSVNNTVDVSVRRSFTNSGTDATVACRAKLVRQDGGKLWLFAPRAVDAGIDEITLKG